MTVKSEIEAYVKEKYSEHPRLIRNILQSLENKSDQELLETYNRLKRRDEQEKEILENGTITYRINYDSLEDEKQIIEYMKNNEMFCLYDGQFDYQIRVGNYCIVGVPLEFLSQIQEKFNNSIKFIDHERKILGRKDIRNLKVGDKVKVILDGIFGLSEAQGTVFSISENEVVVRKYKSKTQGYVLKVGHTGSIEKIKKFQKTA
jgi:hypothetical protein